MPASFGVVALTETCCKEFLHCGSPITFVFCSMHQVWQASGMPLIALLSHKRCCFGIGAIYIDRLVVWRNHLQSTRCEPGTGFSIWCTCKSPAVWARALGPRFWAPPPGRFASPQLPTATARHFVARLCFAGFGYLRRFLVESRAPRNRKNECWCVLVLCCNCSTRLTANPNASSGFGASELLAMPG